ncbi:MAG TPA: UvrD-helicase domain-containing protein [Phycisphaerae bacterium]|nr:UvrD-helicase domain-containing protein [Phycisphaerae bacterium]HRY68337.1 UvrD-helicase domain-containing protein [Phycisphaerae bacterium]HSA26780.1 UvrD-helicase domain-containing protein [Phycisphaerae bacterium]
MAREPRRPSEALWRRTGVRPVDAGHGLLAHLTDSQRRAVLTVDRSVLVSAAAGSGKTTVLAERCAALVCDLPAGQRCEMDELLVVTFTQAAAEEMRTRIGKAIQKRVDRLGDGPDKSRLNEQLYQLDSASISTIHSFCQTLIRRWFPQAGVDPQVTVLAGDESELLRREVLQAQFADLYSEESARGDAFRGFVDEYGGGRDEPIAPIVLGLHRFLNSLAEPDGWLARALKNVDVSDPEGLVARLDHLQQERLGRELQLQAEYCDDLAATIRQCWSVAAMHAEAIDEHAVRLREWLQLASGSPECWQQAADLIHGFEFEVSRRRPRSLSQSDTQAFEAAKKLRDQLKRLHERLDDDFCRFTADEYRGGMLKIAPHVRTLADLATEFGKRYQAAKREQAVIDFEDLQRGAFRLLSEGGRPDRPSEIARQLQGQYRYVLVDEFQDVDPLQIAILELVSREKADPPEGNLFAVGDIKQSIYRFRLAEPQVFTTREDGIEAGTKPGEVIRLQENFRSRAAVIDAVNAVFRPLMSRQFGGSDYDNRAELHAGTSHPVCVDRDLAGDAAGFDRSAIEMHILEPVAGPAQQATPSVTEGESAEGEDQRGPEFQDAADELEGIEREAFLIARRIGEWMGGHPEGKRFHVADHPAAPGSPPAMRPLQYRDVVILLRSLQYKAGPIAEVLRRMGIPVRIEGQESAWETTEFNDVVSLLRVLDNRRQDIPLASVLRSRLLKDQFDETELLEIRLLNHGVPFHEVVMEYADRGPDESLRDRVAQAMAMLDRYRERVRCNPVAEVLWELYEETGYLAYASGLPGGLQRRDHLIRLHELAREFGRFARQGLRRFLRYIEDLLAAERAPEQVSGGSAADDVVRIMTIHGSKGLEFPVVVLADLQKRFNLQDATATILIDRQYGIAPRAADAERRIRYPTLIHQIAADHIRQESLSEELRVLYVALTRAREHLLLVGRMLPARVATLRHRRAASGGSSCGVSRYQLEKAAAMQDWLLPAICSAPAGTVEWAGESGATGPPPLFKIYVHDRATTDAWHIPPAVEVSRAEPLARLADLQPLPADEPRADDESIEPIVAALTSQYPCPELTTLLARMRVTEVKRRLDPTLDPDEVPRPGSTSPGLFPRPLFLEQESIPDAADIGTVTHRFLQLVDLGRSCDAWDLAVQLERLIEQGRMTAEDAGRVLLDGVAWFLDSDLGRLVRRRAADVRREVPVTCRVSPDKVDPLVHSGDARDVVLIRGMVDLLLVDSDGLEILDYKTDAVEGRAVPSRAALYRVQMDAYSEALRTIYRRPVRRRSLVFLRAKVIVELDG